MICNMCLATLTSMDYKILIMLVASITYTILIISAYYDSINKKTKGERLAQKALTSDFRMQRYISRIVKSEYKRIHKQSTVSSDSLQEQTWCYIKPLVTELLELEQKKDIDLTLNYQSFQETCFIMLDSVKQILKTDYKNTKYQQAAECIVTYLSIIEVVFLSHDFKNDWKHEMWLYLIGILRISTHNEKFIQPEVKTIDDMINSLQKNPTKSEEWYQSLKEDLKLFQKYYGKYKFNTHGTLYFPGGICS